MEDAFGPYLRCYSGCWQRDLLLPPPETLALLVRIESYKGSG